MPSSFVNRGRTSAMPPAQTSAAAREPQGGPYSPLKLRSPHRGAHGAPYVFCRIAAPAQRKIVSCMRILRHFGELDQAALGAGGIEIGDAAARVSAPRHLVDQRNALRLELLERLVDVLDLEADVIDAGLALVAHLR